MKWVNIRSKTWWQFLSNSNNARRPLKWLSQPYLLVQGQQWKHENNVTSSKFTIKTPRRITSLFAVYVGNFEQF